MIIGIDASRANRSHKSGTEWYAYHLIRELSELDPDNNYILYIDRPLTNCLADLTQTVDLAVNCVTADFAPVDAKGYQEVKCRHNNFRAKVLAWPFRFLWTQGRLSLEMIFNRPDLLFIPSHTLPIIHPARSVVTIHDIGFERDDHLYLQEKMGPDNMKTRRLLDFLARFMTLGKYGANRLDYYSWSTIFALKHASRVITVSDFSKNEMIDVYQNRKKSIKNVGAKVTVIHNGYDRHIYRSDLDGSLVERSLKKYGVSGKYILYVGRLDKKKNILNLIEGFSLLLQNDKTIPHKLVLAGDASFGYDEMTYMVRQFGLDVDERIIKTGWVEESDLPYFYRGAAAFVFPSFYEGFGIPLLQAMACGIPIAASRAASIPEVAGDAAILFDPSDPQEIADALKEVLIDESRRISLIEAGFKRSNGFSWEKTAIKTLDLLNGLAVR